MNDAVYLLIGCQSLKANVKDFVVQRIHRFLVDLNRNNLAVKFQLYFTSFTLMAKQFAYRSLVNLQRNSISQRTAKNTPRYKARAAQLLRFHSEISVVYTNNIHFLVPPRVFYAHPYSVMGVLPSIVVKKKHSYTPPHTAQC